MNFRNADKQLVLLGFLASGVVHTYFDPRHPAVVLPDLMRRGNRVCISYGDAVEQPPTDVQVTDEGVSATVIVNGQPLHTFVPWASVLYLETPAGGRAMWLSDYPDDLRKELEDAVEAAAEAEDEVEAVESISAAGGAVVSSRTRPEWLRIV